MASAAAIRSAVDDGPRLAAHRSPCAPPGGFYVPECSELHAALFGDDAACDEAQQPQPFAAPDSLAASAAYLEPVLRDLGLRQWQLRGGDPSAALNSLYELVQLQQGVAGAKEALQEQLHQARCDAKAADRTIQRLQSQSEAKGQEAGGLNIKLRQLDAWYREEAERWAAEREELVRKCGQLEQRHAQFQHELRRRDGEFERLQKALAGHLAAAERRRAGGGGGALSGSVAGGPGGSRPGSRGNAGGARPGSSNGQLDTRRLSKAELEDSYKRAVEAHEAERQALQRDADALRKALQGLEREHKDALNRIGSAARSSSSSGSTVAGAAGGGLGPGDAASAAASQHALPDPAAALQRMRSNLAALRVRKQRIIGGAPLSELQHQAESASERLLQVKLQEAARIIEEQETALALALKAIPGCRDPQ